MKGTSLGISIHNCYLIPRKNLFLILLAVFNYTKQSVTGKNNTKKIRKIKIETVRKL